MLSGVVAQHHHHADAAVVADTANRGRLVVALGLIASLMAAEVVAGILAHSLALLSDAAHMLTDAGALALSLIALRLAARPAWGNLTFGLRRAEILSAQANGATLLVLAGLIVYEAIHRLIEPPEVGGWTVVVVAVAGMLINLVATMQLRSADRENMAIEGASSTSSRTCTPSPARWSQGSSSSRPDSTAPTRSRPSQSLR